jgi:PGF-CTERM protein
MSRVRSTLAVLLVCALALGPAAATVDAAAAPAVDAPATPVRDVVVDDVGPANRSNLSGVQPVEAGTTLLVRGTTNRRPDDNAIDVSVVDGPDADAFGFVVVETWGTDGVWTARLDVPANATSGTYTLRVAVGSERDIREFEVVERGRAAVAADTRENGPVSATVETPTPTVTSTSTPTPTPTSTPTARHSPTPLPTTAEATSGPGPGFGAPAATAALLAVAAWMVRRRR